MYFCFIFSSFEISKIRTRIVGIEVTNTDHSSTLSNYKKIREVVVTQMVERSLPTPEFCGSNPGISDFYLLSTVLKRQK